MKTLRKKLLLVLIACNTYLMVSAQGYYFNSENDKKMYFGLGTGMDYGGIGGKLEYLPVKYIGLYAGIGTNLLTIGINGGISLKVLPNSKITPVIQGMYGYNGVIIIKDSKEHNKTYYGFSTGAGAEWKLGRKDNKLYFGAFYPFRTQAFFDGIEKVKADPRIWYFNDPLPVTFSIGFNWSLF